jgi:hypothetical protein
MAQGASDITDPETASSSRRLRPGVPFLTGADMFTPKFEAGIVKIYRF